jgi:hypothetical protein
VSGWWEALAVDAVATGAARFSPEWYAAMRDLYLERYPGSDERSKDNMRLIAEWHRPKLEES